MADSELFQAALNGDIATVKRLLAAGLDTIAPEEIANIMRLACANGDLPVVQTLIEAGADPNMRVRQNTTALQQALEQGEIEVAKYLLQQGANAYFSNDPGLLGVAIFSEARYGRAWHYVPDATLTRLLVEGGALMNARYGQLIILGDYTALDSARENFHPAAEEYLVAHGAVSGRPQDAGSRLDQAVTAGDREKVVRLLSSAADSMPAERILDAFTRAASSGRLDIVKTFIEAGVDANAALPLWRGGNALFAALGQHRFAIAEYLLAQGADINSTNSLGQTPLFTVVAGEADGGAQTFQVPEVSGTEFFLAHGGNPHVRDNSGKTALDLANKQWHPAAAKLLRDLGVECKPESMRHQDRIWDAVLEEDLAHFERLLKGEQSEDTQRDLRFALWMASFWGRLPVVRMLIEGGLDPDTIVDDHEWTALFQAIANGQPETARYLLDHGASVNHPSDSPLWRAIDSEDKQGRRWNRAAETTLSAMLINYGADVNNHTRQGHTPLDLAIWTRHRAAEALIRAHGGVLGTRSSPNPWRIR